MIVASHSFLVAAWLSYYWVVNCCNTGRKRIYLHPRYTIYTPLALIMQKYVFDVQHVVIFIHYREFTMAEIEHFCDPSDKSHPKFDSVKDVEVTLYSACNQMEGELPEERKIGDAVKMVCSSSSSSPFYQMIAFYAFATVRNACQRHFVFLRSVSPCIHAS